MERTYIAIDLKSFYASVECQDRQLDPLDTNLVVADVERTEKTICLAVSPSLKKYGLPGRARLFEVIQKVNEINKERLQKAPGHKFTGKSCSETGLAKHPEWELSYIAATPRMATYVDYSTKIYDVYLKYVAPEDIHVYSIDEVFMDVTNYLAARHMTPKQMASAIVKDVMETTGITATAGIGSNLYLCKVAMDILAKHAIPDENGVRIAILDEMSYREQLWEHRPLTDFWRVGRGYATKLEENGLFTMGDIARCSIGKPTDFYNEDLLYKLFGINAELLIDHAWGWEPVQMSSIKEYKPKTNCLSTGQVLHCPYTYEGCRLIIKEMTDLFVLDMVDKGLVTDQLVLMVGYDIENVKKSGAGSAYQGEIVTDYFGRRVPKHAHGTVNLPQHSSSTQEIMQALLQLYDEIVDHTLLIRRVNITANHLIPEKEAKEQQQYQQMSLFANYEQSNEEQEKKQQQLSKERRLQEAMLSVKKKYGKNAMLKGMNLEEGGTTIERNSQIGGHRA